MDEFKQRDWPRQLTTSIDPKKDNENTTVITEVTLDRKTNREIHMHWALSRANTETSTLQSETDRHKQWQRGTSEKTHTHTKQTLELSPT